MHKIRVTKTEMRENHFILGIGYCDAQSLLRYENPIAYSSGAYGWSCDYYLIKLDNSMKEVIISTGYSPLNTKNMNRDYNKIRKYEEKANAIIRSYDWDYKDQKKKVQKLLQKLVKECIEGAN